MRSTWYRTFLMALLSISAVSAVSAPSALALSTTADTTGMVDGKVFALAQYGNTLYVGGRFTHVLSSGGAPLFEVHGLAAFDMTTGNPVAGFAPAVGRSSGVLEVRALSVSSDGTRLYAGGRFDTVDGAVHKNFAAIDTATGLAVPTFKPRVAGSVHVVLATPSLIYVGGAFTSANGQPRARLAAYSPAGALDAGWTPVANDTVRSLALSEDGTTMFVGGHFTTMNLSPRQSVARVDRVTGALNSWAIPAGTIDTPQTAWALLQRGIRLYVGFGKGPNYLSSFRLDNGTFGSQVWKFNTVGNVESVAMNAAGTKLFAGGHFGTARLQQSVCGGTNNLHGVMAVNPATGAIDCTWVPQLTPFGHNYTGVWTMLTTSTQLWIGGYISTIAGQQRLNLARFTL
jgi:hypothetical protein